MVPSAHPARPLSSHVPRRSGLESCAASFRHVLLFLHTNHHFRNAALAQYPPNLPEKILKQCVGILEHVRLSGIAFGTMPVIACRRPPPKPRTCAAYPVSVIEADQPRSIR